MLSVIGAPIEDGAGLPGSIMGPAALRTAGLIRTLRELGHEVDDRGDLRLPEGIPQPVTVAGSLRNLASIVGWSRLLCRRGSGTFRAAPWRRRILAADGCASSSSDPACCSCAVWAPPTAGRGSGGRHVRALTRLGMLI